MTIMAFTDQELATKMRDQLVTSNVMTADERTYLLENSTENDVREKLTSNQLDNFGNYWQAVGDWIDNRGGDFSTLSGTNAQGRTGGNPQGLAAKALYNDAFKDVRDYINEPNFSAVKAVSNQLRFIDVMLE